MRALAITEKALGPDHRAMGANLNNLVVMSGADEADESDVIDAASDDVVLVAAQCRRGR